MFLINRPLKHRGMSTGHEGYWLNVNTICDLFFSPRLPEKKKKRSNAKMDELFVLRLRSFNSFYDVTSLSETVFVISWLNCFSPSTSILIVSCVSSSPPCLLIISFPTPPLNFRTPLASLSRSPSLPHLAATSRRLTAQYCIYTDYYYLGERLAALCLTPYNLCYISRGNTEREKPGRWKPETACVRRAFDWSPQ